MDQLLGQIELDNLDRGFWYHDCYSSAISGCNDCSSNAWTRICRWKALLPDSRSDCWQPDKAKVQDISLKKWLKENQFKDYHCYWDSLDLLNLLYSSFISSSSYIMTWNIRLFMFECKMGLFLSSFLCIYNFRGRRSISPREISYNLISCQN